VVRSSVLIQILFFPLGAPWSPLRPPIASPRRHYGLSQLKPFERLSLGHDLAALPAPNNQSSNTAAPLLLTSDPPSGKARPNTSDNKAVRGVEIVTSNTGVGTESCDGKMGPPNVPKTKHAAGVIHLCELDGCQLPPPFGRGNDRRSSGGEQGRNGGHDRGSGRSGGSSSRSGSQRHR